MGGQMKYNKGYEDLEELVVIFFESDEFEKNCALEEIIERFKPLIVKLIMKYYGRYDEDIYQDAVVELINRTLNYDYKHYNKFAAYIKKFLEFHMKRQFIKYINEENKTNANMYEDEAFEMDSYDIEIESMLEALDVKQSYIIKKNVLENKKLKSIAKNMNISYVYAKKIKKEALNILKTNLSA